MFVEKPLSVKPPEEVSRLSQRLQQIQKQKGLIIAVGYMLRYSPAVEVRLHTSKHTIARNIWFLACGCTQRCCTECMRGLECCSNGFHTSARLTVSSSSSAQHMKRRLWLSRVSRQHRLLVRCGDKAHASCIFASAHMVRRCHVTSAPMRSTHAGVLSHACPVSGLGT